MMKQLALYLLTVTWVSFDLATSAAGADVVPQNNRSNGSGIDANLGAAILAELRQIREMLGAMQLNNNRPATPGIDANQGAAILAELRQMRGLLGNNNQR